MRKKIVAGNWKMNMNLEEGLAFAKTVVNYFTAKPAVRGEVILCSPYIHLHGLSEITKGSKVHFGAQNCAAEASGAYTGEISASMVKSTGAQYVILGHSERRTYYHETDSLLSKKITLALKNGLKVIFCCGEVKEEREKSIHFEVVKTQLENGLFAVPAEEMANIVIAYEPVWAIGTGLTATPDQAQEMHNYIRSLLKGKYGAQVAEDTTILYGGSCKPSNAAEIFSKPDVDGGLIGGAALKLEDFAGIVEAI